MAQRAPKRATRTTALSPADRPSSSTGTSAASWWQFRRQAFVVALVAIAASLAGLRNDFVFDDVPQVAENVRVQDLSRVGEILTSSYWPPPFAQELYRPVASLTVAIQYVVGAGSPIVFRVCSYLLYALVSIGVLRLARRVLPERIALGVIFLDVILYSAGGITGTMHHLYFSGTPVEHMALGAFFSAAEVIPLTFLTVEAWSFLQLGAQQSSQTRAPFPHFWSVMFLASVGFWNFLSAGIFGFLINLPIVSYYEIGTALTANHAHAAMMGVYGMLAVGLALADKLRGDRRVTACFFGDGAVAEGEFHECLNLAALWDLPVLFCCENNLYAMGTALAVEHKETDLAVRAATYEIPAWPVDGMDVDADPVGVADLFQTLCRAIGLDPSYELTSPSGRPLKIVDGGQLVSGLFS